MLDELTASYLETWGDIVARLACTDGVTRSNEMLISQKISRDVGTRRHKAVHLSKVGEERLRQVVQGLTASLLGWRVPDQASGRRRFVS